MLSLHSHINVRAGLAIIVKKTLLLSCRSGSLWGHQFAAKSFSPTYLSHSHWPFWNCHHDISLFISKRIVFLSIIDLGHETWNGICQRQSVPPMSRLTIAQGKGLRTGRQSYFLRISAHSCPQKPCLKRGGILTQRLTGVFDCGIKNMQIVAQRCELFSRFVLLPGLQSSCLRWRLEILSSNRRFVLPDVSSRFSTWRARVARFKSCNWGVRVTSIRFDRTMMSWLVLDSSR